MATVRNVTATVAMTAFAAMFVPLAGAPGESFEVRILIGGDYEMVALWSSCDPEPTQEASACVVVRDTLGYDGLTVAEVDSSGHLGHGWFCTIVSQATPEVDALPPAVEEAVAPSFSVAVDTDGDGVPDESYGPGRSVQVPDAGCRLWVHLHRGLDVTIECSL